MKSSKIAFTLLAISVGLIGCGEEKKPEVKKGGQGVWGQVPMPPNATVPDADLKALVKRILSQK